MTSTHADILAAAAILEGVAHRTPLFRSHRLDARCGGEVVLKAEHLQRAGAFKFRGAYNALHHLTPQQRDRGVLTWSSGNHAQGLALAGRLLQVPITVVMPENSIASKMAATRDYGAEVITCRAGEREAVGQSIAEERGLEIIPPYDHDHIIAGQGTAGLELLEDAGELDLILTPVGGGGLLAGTALAAVGFRRDDGGPRVIGIEPQQADDAARSFRGGSIVRIDVPDTIADGLRTPYLGERNFEIIRRDVADIVTVSEDEIITALRYVYTRLKLAIEPSSAVPVAALLSARIEARGLRVGVILSGGNFDPEAIGSLLAESS